jgi:purine-nucleoside phosphorylase
LSTHIEAKKGDIADIVLLPGDPLRAEYIAQNFLTNAKRYNTVRNAWGYTGTYGGTPVSVQATGMGIPSISIYANELIQDYDVHTLIRVGTAGSINPDVNIRDIVLAQGASTDSAVVDHTFKDRIHYAPIADFGLLDRAYHAAKDAGYPVHVGNVLSEDQFYAEGKDFALWQKYGILALEMECAALYLIAAEYGRHALGVMTISNNILTGEETTSEERARTFSDMMNVALKAAVNHA